MMRAVTLSGLSRYGQSRAGWVSVLENDDLFIRLADQKLAGSVYLLQAKIGYRLVTRKVLKL